ncbi:MAG: signal peptidase I [candidate division Zixibacteria bacterium]|nr:signal peptidase I [candidate division Zixibacteria bacterium]
MDKKILAGSYGYLKALFWAVLLAFFVKASLAEAYRVPSSSMEDTLLIGDFVVSNKLLYGGRIPFFGWRLPEIRHPRPGDVITFKWPGDRKTDYVKRCVAVEGQVVEVRDKVLYVDGKAFPDPARAKYIAKGKPLDKNDRRDYFGPFTVPPETIFAMGDNRDNSYDSRYWGPVPLELVEGKVIGIQWSIAPDDNAPKIDPAHFTSIPVTFWHTITNFVGRIRWDRTVRSVS